MLTLTKTTLAQLRKRAGYRSQQALADKLTYEFKRSISDTTISAWETGRWLPNLTPKETSLFCQILGITLDELIQAFEDIENE